MNTKQLLPCSQTRRERCLGLAPPPRIRTPPSTPASGRSWAANAKKPTHNQPGTAQRGAHWTVQRTSFSGRTSTVCFWVLACSDDATSSPRARSAKGGGVEHPAVRTAGHKHDQHFRAPERPSPKRPRPSPHAARCERVTPFNFMRHVPRHVQRKNGQQTLLGIGRVLGRSSNELRSTRARRPPQPALRGAPPSERPLGSVGKAASPAFQAAKSSAPWPPQSRPRRRASVRAAATMRIQRRPAR